MRAIVVMGVAGSGKSTLGRALATRLSLPFHDADDYHPLANIAKMRSGTPLDDADRQPWLDTLSGLLAEPSVLACSALKQEYRQRLSQHATPVFVYLRITAHTARARLRARPGHFMPDSLVTSQFDTLEEPVDAIVVDAELELETALDSCMRELREPLSGQTGPTPASD